MRWLLEATGIDTTATEYSHKRFGFALLVRAQHWDVLISKECSGFARIVMFVALFASMLLQNPARLRSSVAVVTSFIGGLVAVLGVEAVRWAALVAFAERTLRDAGRTPAAYQAVEAYHRAGGQWSVSLSLVLLAVYFYAVSRWLDRRAGTHPANRYVTVERHPRESRQEVVVHGKRYRAGRVGVAAGQGAVSAGTGLALARLAVR